MVNDPEAQGEWPDREHVHESEGMMRIPILFSKRQPNFIFRDDFTDTLSAGSVNGTKSTDRKETRIVTDTGNRLSVHDGYAETTTANTGVAGDPSLKYQKGVSRIANKTLSLRVTPSIITGASYMGFLKNTTISLSNCIGLLLESDAGIRFVDYDGASAVARDRKYVAGETIDFAISARETGYFYYLRNNNAWQLAHISDVGSTATLYQFWTPMNNPGKFTKARLFNGVLPVPKLSDGFSSALATDGLGHPERNGGGGLTPSDWKGTFDVSGGKAQATALDGTWGEAIRAWNVGSNTVFAQATLTRSAGLVGIMIAGRSSDNCILICHDGTRVQIYSHARGGARSLLYQTGNVAFGSGKLKVWTFRPANGGTYINVRWDNNECGWNGGLLVSAGEYGAGLNAGIFTTDLGNTIDDFVVFASGNDMEYSWLDRKTGFDQSWVCSEKHVVFDGNSLTAGGNLATDYPIVTLNSLGAPYTGRNIAIGGQDGNTMLSDQYAASFYNSQRSQNIYVYWEGINDFTTYTGEVSYQHTVDRCSAMRALGYRVVVLTCHMSGGKSAEYYTRRTNYNNLIIANYASFADALVRIDQNAIIGDSGNPDNTTYYNANKVHLTAAGNAIVAGLAVTGIQSV